MANDTKIYLLNVPLESDYKHTFYFENATAQIEYFQSKVIESKTDCSYQRKDNIIRYPAHYDYIASKNANYVMYRNMKYNNKWFFAFIKEKKYVNEAMTELYIETDRIQTFLFDYTVQTSFVEREHVNNDSVGANLVEENLQIGEYVVNAHGRAGYTADTTPDSTDDRFYIVVGVTELSDGTRAEGTLYNGIYSGIQYFAFPLSEYNTTLKSFLNAYDSGKAEAIVCMFLAPNKLLEGYLTNNKVSPSINPSRAYLGVSGGTPVFSEFKKNMIDGYSPKNNKLLTYPYRYLLASNNNGSEVAYKYENWYTRTGTNESIKSYVDPAFAIEGCLTPGCSIRMVPMYYKGDTVCDVEGINMGKFPALNWTSDYFTNWLTQNAVNIGVQGVTSAVSLIGGLGLLATGAGAGAGAGGIISGLTGIASTVGEVYKADLVPNQAQGNLNSGDVITSSNRNDFHFYDMCVKKEFALIIDNYFDMFGYKINRVKVPLKNHRARYWFTKTIDCNIDGGIDNEDLAIIKNCYNNGITFWRSSETIGSYGGSNAIV